MRLAIRLLVVAAAALSASCRTESVQPAQEAQSQSQSTLSVKAAAVSIASANVVSATLSGEIAIADNFSDAAGIERTGYPSGIGGGTPPQSIDSVGAFRMFCTAGQLLKDDPLVYPGQP